MTDRPRSTLRRGIRPCQVVVLVAAWLAILVIPAGAHSFLARTSPAQGERLSAPPGEIALQLSEPVEQDSVRVRVADGDGTPVELGRTAFDSGGAVVRVPLVSPGEGLYRVSWHVVSAVDGHESAGELAFAVGDEIALEGGSTTTGRGARTPLLATVATWVLLAGWSVAFGAAVLAWRAAGADLPGRPRDWIRGGTLTALAGLAVRAGATSGERIATVVLVAGLALAVALALAPARRTWAPLAALVTFAAFWPGRGHAATSAVGWLLDAVHLGAVGLWGGGLTVVVVALGAAARAGRPRDPLPLVRVYARTAMVALVVLVVSGVALGWSLVGSPNALLTGSYGRLLVVKAALLLVAATFAVIARRRLARSDLAGVWRLVRPEYAALALAVAVAAILVDTPPQPPTVETLLGPPPIEGPVARVAGMAGQITLDVQAGDGRLDVNARGPSGGIDVDLALAATLPDGTVVDLHPRPCGTGCATLQFEPAPGKTTLTATAQAEGWTGGTTSLPLDWPPGPAQPSLFDEMRDAMLAVDRVHVVEAAHGIDPPPEGAGTSLTGSRLVELMPWAGGGVTDVRPVAGEPGRFTFYLPGSHMWFEVTVDSQGRLVTQRLVNPGHDIRYRFTYPTTDADAPSRP